MDLNWMGRGRLANSGQAGDHKHTPIPNSEDGREKKESPAMLAPVPKKDRVAPAANGDLSD